MNHINSILKRLYWKSQKDINHSITTGVDIDNNVNILFERYRDELIKDGHSCLPGAIWGPNHCGEQTNIQKIIYETVNPYIKKIVNEISRDEKYGTMAIEYILRQMIVYKFAYLIDVSRLRIENRYVRKCRRTDVT